MGGFFRVVRSLVNQAHGQSTISRSHYTAAGTAQAVFGNHSAIAGLAGIAVHSESVLTDTAGFCGKIAHTKPLTSSSRSKTFALLQGGKYLVGLGFRIDELQRCFPFSNRSAVVQRV